jgi:predicted nucleotidyltransferase
VAAGIAPDLKQHRGRAVAAARTAVDALANLGVSALVVGSLARGNFGVHSDIDFLIIGCPKEKKYAIEGVVEDAMEGMKFDVVYLDELPDWKRPQFLRDAIDARHLR